MLASRTVVALAAASFSTVAGSASVSAQENCGFMSQRVMEAYRMQSPHYGEMLNHYNARCLSGASSQPAWEGHHQHSRQDQDRRADDTDRRRRGW